MAEENENWRLHVGLFLLTCATTFWAGAHFSGAFSLGDGIAFSATLMGILVCHEMGHFVVARRHGIDCSLPYFIPLPPMISLGTMGAVIRMRSPLEDRNQLVDVGASGPIAGLVVCLPLLWYGLSVSEVREATGGMVEGNSILYWAVKYLVHGATLPTPEGLDVHLHPIAWAAWVGLLLTMINLIPIGQLDGGHVAAGALGSHHERVSRWLHGGMLLVFLAVAAWVAVPAISRGGGWWQALWAGARAGLPWLVWATMLWAIKRSAGGEYHPDATGPGLTVGRKCVVAVVVVLFFLILTPVPLREWQP